MGGQLGEWKRVRRDGKAWSRQESQRPHSTLLPLVNVSDGRLLGPSSGVPHGSARCLRVSSTQHFSGMYYMLDTVLGTRDKGKNITVCF